MDCRGFKDVTIGVLFPSVFSFCHSDRLSLCTNIAKN